MNYANESSIKPTRQSYTFSQKLLEKAPATLDFGEEVRQLEVAENRSRIKSTFAGKLAIIINQGQQRKTKESSPVECDEVNDERLPTMSSRYTLAASVADKLDVDVDLLNHDNIVLNTKDFFQQFETLESLGEGCIAVVKRVKHRRTGELFAAKMVKTNNEEIIKSIVVEFNSLFKLRHENIVHMKRLFLDYDDSFMCENSVIILMELVEGREMFDVLNTLGRYDEEDARRLFSQLLNGILHLHQNGICHRDLKPHNILCEKDNRKLKITDFNVSKFVNAPKEFGVLKDFMQIEMWTYTGTIAYCAPERFEGGSYNQMVDMWSAGCILYSMLSGLVPFHGNYIIAPVYVSLHDLINEIQNKEIVFTDSKFNFVSPEAKDLISRLLEKNPAKRLACKDAIHHRWFQNVFEYLQFQDVSAYTLKHFSLHDSMPQLTKNDSIIKYKVILSQVSSSSRFSSQIDGRFSDLSISGTVRKKPCNRSKAYNYQETPCSMDLQEISNYVGLKSKFISDDNLGVYKVTEEDSQQMSF